MKSMPSALVKLNKVNSYSMVKFQGLFKYYLKVVIKNYVVICCFTSIRSTFQSSPDNQLPFHTIPGQASQKWRTSTFISVTVLILSTRNILRGWLINLFKTDGVFRNGLGGQGGPLYNILRGHRL